MSRKQATVNARMLLHGDENDPIGVKYSPSADGRPFTIFVRVGDVEIGMTGLTREQLTQFRDEISMALDSEKRLSGLTDALHALRDLADEDDGNDSE